METTVEKALLNTLQRKFIAKISALNVEGDTFTFRCGETDYTGLLNVRRIPDSGVIGFTAEFIHGLREMPGGVIRLLVVLDEADARRRSAVIRLTKPRADMYELAPAPTYITDECGAVTLIFNFKEEKRP
jgi:hypothetical protein